MKKLFLLMLSSFCLTAIQNSFASEKAASTEEGLEYLLFMEIPKVVTSTLSEKDSIKAPSSMTVITEQEIKNYGATRLSELLEEIPGFFLRLNSFGRKIIALRGIRSEVSNAKFKLLYNGHAVAEPSWGEFLDFYDIGLEDVHQIEIIKGPGSALYGTNAFAGIINIIPKETTEKKFMADVKGGSYNTKRAYAGYTDAGENWKFKINTDYLDTNGPDPVLERDSLYGTPFTLAPSRVIESERASNTLTNITYKDFSLTANYVNSERHNPVPQLSFLTENGEKNNVDYWFVDASKNLLELEKFKIKLDLSYDSVDYSVSGQALPRGFMLPLDLGTGIPSIQYWPNGGFGNFGYKSGEFRSELLFEYQVSDTNKLLIGTFYEETKRNDVFIEANLNTLYYLAYPTIVDQSLTNNWSKDSLRSIGGAFFQDEWDITNQWYLVLGGRYDHYNDFGSTFNPRCGLVYDINGKGGTVKLLYGSAFRAPTAAELYNRNNISLVGNENLDAEDIQSVELIFSYIFAEKVITSLSLYNTQAKHLVDVSLDRDYSQPGAPEFYVNRGKNEINGAELEVKYVFQQNNYVALNYSYTDAQDEDTDRKLAFIPSDQLNLAYNLYALDHLNWNINMDYVGKLPREYGDPREDLDATTTFNSTLRWDNYYGFDLYFSVFNMFNKKVYAPSTLALYPTADLQQSERTYYIGLTKVF